MSKTIRILYIDDNPLDRELVRDALEKEHVGFELVTTASRTDFETALAKGGFDLILSDFNILGFDGLQVIEAVFAKDSKLPIVIVTGTGSEEIAIEAMKRGASEYVIKTPQHIQRLPQTIQAVLAKKKLEEERNQAENALRESEDRYRDLVENSSDLICTHDLEGKLLSVNETALRLTGYSRADLLQMNMAALLTPQASRFFSAYLKEIQTTGHAYGLMEIQTASGETRIWEYNNSLRTEGMDAPVVRGMAHDITERKRAEAALRDIQMQLEGIFNSTMDAIITIDEEQKIIIFNPAAEHMFRCPAAEAIGGTLDRFLPENLRDGHKKSVHAFGQSNETKRSMKTPVTLTFTSLRADGEAFPSEVSISQLNLGGRKLYTAIVRDVTERQQAEDALRASENFRRLIVDTEPECVKVIAPNGGLIEMNAAGLAIIEADSLEQVKGAPIIEFVAPEYRDSFGSLHKRVMSGESGMLEFEIIGLKGTRRWLETHAVPLRNNSNQIEALLGVTRDITERKQAEKKIRRQIDYLTALQDIDRTIASAFDMRHSLNALIAKAVSLLSVDAAAVLLINSTMNTLEFAAGDGFRTNAVKTANVKLGKSYAGRAVIEKHIIKFPNPKDEPDNLFLTGLLKEEEFVSYYGVPLIVKENVIGVLEVFHRSLIKRDQEWLDFLNALAGQAAIAISNAQLFDNLQQSNNELIQAYDATIEGWSRAMDLRDKETEGHTLRVTKMAMRLAGLMHISDAEQAHIHRGALLHDIGKLGVPDSILHKPDQLTDEEWVIMRQHPTHAYEMLSSINYLKPALDIPYCHHEKWDGTGYPRGLKGEQIPLVARIFAVVDVWDALRSDRPYRAGWPEEKVIEYIRAEAGKHFDPKVVKVFLNMIAGK